MHITRGLTGVIAVALAALTAGCAGTSSGAASASPSSRPATSAAGSAPAGPPAGITPLGSSTHVAAQGWDLELTPFQETSAGAAAGDVPAGWTVLRTQARFTNTSDQIALLPDTALTIRYGSLGRQAVAVKDGVLTGLPAHYAGVKEAPGGTYTAEVGVAVPAQGLGQRVTVTAEATQEGMAEADNLFFEGTLPGKTAGDHDAPAPASAPASADPVLPFGAWSQNLVRIAPITLGPAKNGKRQASADLTVANTGSEPRTGLGITLRVLTGAGLSDAAALTAGLDYPDAPIAPSRSATVTVHFSLPTSAVPGPVTIEAVDQGDRTTFSGNVG